MVVYYTSAADVKAYSKLTHVDLGYTTDADLVSFIEGLITIAERIVDRYCCVPDTFFQSGGVIVSNELYDSDGSGILYLKYRPVLSVSALAYNERELTAAPSWVSFTQGPGSNTHFLLYAELGKILIYNSIPGAGGQKIKTSYVAGYSSVPSDVAHAVKALAANMLRSVLKRKLSPLEVSQLITQGGNPSSLFAEDLQLAGEMKAMLAAYRVSRVEAC